MQLKKFIITGGPGSGKSTTIKALSAMGYQTVDEASRIIIEEQLKEGGDIVPWKRLHEFNVVISNLQMELESAAREGTVFLDRGIIDNLAYCEWGGIEPPNELKKAVEKSRYDKVFLLMPLPIVNDVVRRENQAEAEKLSGLIKKAYQSLGYEVIEVPPSAVEDRVKFIIDRAL